MKPSSDACTMCERALSDHDRHVRFELPDPVLRSEARLDAPGTWLSHGDAMSSVMMQVPGEGPFLRALLPIHLTGGHTVTLGVWVAISPSDLQHAFQVWTDDAYADLDITGFLANRIPPWGLLGATVRLQVRDIDHTPYCVSSPDRTLQAVISADWPHQDVLPGLLG